MHDLVIKGAQIFDGRGGDAFTGDIAIDGGVLTEVSGTAGPARRTIDADGAMVTPGFVDVHTHYDAQATWDPELGPSAWHGVTTVVMGNCGVGFAPVRPEHREWLIALMEGVEDIPAAVLEQGLPWGWETYGNYLDVLAARPHATDIAGMVTHAAVRVYAMGERGVDYHETPTPAELDAIRDIVRDALLAGAIGFSTSRSRNHKSRTGEFISSYDANRDELMAIASGMAAAGRGVIEIATDYSCLPVDDEFALLRDMARTANRPMSIPILQMHDNPGQWRVVAGLMADANRDGVAVSAQVPAKSVSLLISLESRLQPFASCPSYQPLATLAVASRAARLREPDVRAAILAEARAQPLPFGLLGAYRLSDPLDYEPRPETAIAELAAAQGIDVIEYAYDYLTAGDGTNFLYRPSNCYVSGNLDVIREMMLTPHTAVGLGDGGAHCTFIADASNPTYLLTHWGRDRTRGERLPLGFLVKKQAADTAALFGLNDRGVLAPGYKADLNVIDWPNLRMARPEMAYDLPSGGKRLVQRAHGYVATVVAGEVTYRDGAPTGAYPGRVVRNSS